MRRLLLIIGCLCLVFTGAAYAEIDTAWVRTYDGPGHGIDQANFIGMDAAGYIYIAGKSRGDGTLDDHATIKYNADGDTLWLRRYGGTGFEYINDMSVDAAGNVYATGAQPGAGGVFESITIKYNTDGDTLWVRPLNVGNQSRPDHAYALDVDAAGNVYITGETEVADFDEDIFVAKYDAAGTLLWDKRYLGGSSSDVGWRIVTDGSGNAYVFGTEGNGDYLVIKYDSDGDTLWTRTYDSPYGAFEHPVDMCMDDAGNVYITGTSDQALTNKDFATIKYSPSGAVLWIRHLIEGESTDEADAILADGNGNVYVIGKSDTTETWDDYDWLTVKYNSSGDTLWTRRYAGPANENDVPLGIAVDDDGNVYVTGYARDNITASDCVTVKYTADGDLVWSHWLNGAANQNDAGSDIIVDANQKVYVTGAMKDASTDYMTIKYVDCDCPFQGDMNEDELQNPLDLVTMINVVLRGLDDVQDPLCPTTRADYNGNGVADAVDITQIIDWVYFAQPSLVDPCSCIGGFPCAHEYSVEQANSVVVTSKSVALGETGVEIPIHITNDAELRSLVVPLVLREIVPGSFITSLKLSWGDRLPPDPGSPLSQIRFTNQYAPEDGACKQGQAGGFGTIAYDIDTLAHPVSGSPVGALFYAAKIFDPAMAAASDNTGSLILTVDITGTDGLFEIDTTCTDPANHLMFLENVYVPDGVTPSFTKGVITIGSGRQPIVVSNLEVAGQGSLFDAIMTANEQPGPDSIIFTVAGVIPRQPAVPFQLEDATGGTVVDGLSAPGATEEVPTIIIDGSLAAEPAFEIFSAGNSVKGLTIRDFPGTAIVVNGPGALGNTITANRIHGNGGLAIDLGLNGVTENDPGDTDDGPNDLLNYPTLDTIFLADQDSFYVAGLAPPDSRVELFLAQRYLGADTIADPTGYGEAWEYLGSTTANGSGHFAFSTIGAGYWSYVTATATDASGNTSEFSKNRQLIPDSLIITVYSPVKLKVIEPDDSDSIGLTFNTIGPTATYDEGTDYGVGPNGTPGELDDRIVITNVQEGTYKIIVEADESGGGGEYFCGIRVDGTEEAYVAGTAAMSSMPVAIPVPDEGEEDEFTFNPTPAPRGDFDGDGFLTALDLAVMIDILFAGAPLPDPPELADLNCDGFPDALDLGLIIDHLFAGGDAPCL